MNAAHTPGPWHWDGQNLRPVNDDDKVRTILDESGGMVYRALPVGAACAQIEADKLLIAAAPELLDALSKLVEDLEMRANWKRGDDKGVVDCGHSVYMNARAAITKAKGGAA